MWIVIDILGFAAEDAIIATNVDGENLLFDTEDQAMKWASEECGWDWRVVEI